MKAIHPTVSCFAGIHRAKKAIASAKTIVITGHRNPDGDSLGSLLALGLGLRRMGKQVYLLCDDKVPQRYMFLPGVRRIVRRVSVTPDVAIAVDCSNKDLIGDNFDVFRKAAEIIEIDHHEFRRSFGTIQCVDHRAAAVGEIVYVLLRALQVPITRSIAENLLTSLIVETNSFRLPAVRGVTFALCAKLIAVGIDYYKLADRIFWSASKESMILMGVCLSRCAFLSNGKIVYSIIREKDFARVGGTDADVDPVIEQMRAINHVQVAVLFREKSRVTLRVSLRSKGRRINVAKIAEKYLGGGHYDIAGCVIRNSPESIRQFLGQVQQFLNSHIHRHGSDKRRRLSDALAGPRAKKNSGARKKLRYA